MAPQGVGILYANPAVRAMLRPTNVGWGSIAWRDGNTYDYESPILEGTARFEEGNRSLVGIAGLEQSLKLLLDVGITTIADHVHRLTDHLAERLLQRGFHLQTPLLPEARSGILTFSHSQRSAHELWERLRAARIVAAVREGGVRISPHLYNSVDEIDAIIDALEGSRS